MKSDKLPQVMSLVAEDYEFENGGGKMWRCGVGKK